MNEAKSFKLNFNYLRGAFIIWLLIYILALPHKVYADPIKEWPQLRYPDSTFINNTPFIMHLENVYFKEDVNPGKANKLPLWSHNQIILIDLPDQSQIRLVAGCNLWEYGITYSPTSPAYALPGMTDTIQCTFKSAGSNGLFYDFVMKIAINYSSQGKNK